MTTPAGLLSGSTTRESDVLESTRVELLRLQATLRRVEAVVRKAEDAYDAELNTRDVRDALEDK